MAGDDLADVLQLFCSQEVAGAAQPSSPTRVMFKKCSEEWSSGPLLF